MPKIVDKQAMQTRILDAAMGCFLDQGFHVTKMEDVARAAGLAKGTLYLYFKGKDEVMLALLTRYFSDIRQRIAAMPAPPSLAALLEGVRRTMPVERLDATVMFFDVLGPGFTDPRAKQIFSDFFDWLAALYAEQFRDLAAQGELRADLDPMDAGGAVVAMLDGLVIHLSLFQSAPDDFARRRDAAIALLASGLDPARAAR